MLRAVEKELHLNKPWGEVMPYDFVVEHEGQFARVQVKSMMFKDRGGYSCTVRGSDGPYEGNPFEYLAAYVFQEDMWYIIPGEMVVGQGSIALYPKLKGAKYGPYKEAWHLLRREAPKPGGWTGLRLAWRKRRGSGCRWGADFKGVEGRYLAAPSFLLRGGEKLLGHAGAAYGRPWCVMGRAT
jgi:hypothetical protein